MEPLTPFMVGWWVGGGGSDTNISSASTTLDAGSTSATCDTGRLVCYIVRLRDTSAMVLLYLELEVTMIPPCSDTATTTTYIKIQHKTPRYTPKTRHAASATSLQHIHIQSTSKESFRGQDGGAAAGDAGRGGGSIIGPCRHSIQCNNSFT